MILLSHARNNCVLVALIVNSLIINEMIWVLNKWRYPIPTYCDLDAFFPLQVSLMLLREYALSGCPEGCWSQSVILPALCSCRILQAYSLATGSHTPEPDVWVEVDPEIWVDPAWPRYKIQNKSVSSPFGVIETYSQKLGKSIIQKDQRGKEDAQNSPRYTYACERLINVRSIPSGTNSRSAVVSTRWNQITLYLL